MKTINYVLLMLALLIFSCKKEEVKDHVVTRRFTIEKYEKFMNNKLMSGYDTARKFVKLKIVYVPGLSNDCYYYDAAYPENPNSSSGWTHYAIFQTSYNKNDFYSYSDYVKGDTTKVIFTYSTDSRKYIEKRTYRLLP